MHKLLKPNHPIELCALLFLAWSSGAFAQATSYPPWIMAATTDSAAQDLSRIAAASEAYFDQQGRGSRTGYKHYRRWLWFAQQRLGADGRLFNFPGADQAACQASSTTRSTAPWQALGPTSFGLAPGSGFNGGLGHVSDLTVGPSGELFVATATGGLWKRAPGAGWVPLTNQEVPVPVLSSVALDPSDPDTIYLLTGDGDGRSAPSQGVLRSTDGGDTWQAIGPSFGKSIVYGYRLAIPRLTTEAPTGCSPPVLFAATTGGVYGLYRQTGPEDMRWDVVLPPDDFGGYYQVVFHTSDPSIVYAAGVNAVYRSTDCGSTWPQLEGGLPVGIDSQRVALAVTPAAPDSLYVLYGGGVGYLGLYVSTAAGKSCGSTDGGKSFGLRSNSPNLLSYEPEGTSFLGAGIPTYALTVAVSPTDPDRIRVGSQMVWESIDGGVDWRLTSYWDDRDRRSARVGFVHNDIHEIVDLGSTLYVATDGGVSTSNDGGQTWQDQSAGLNITQMYRISSTPQDQDVVFFSAQDNGSSVLKGGVATQQVDYDGTAFLVDPGDAQRMFIGYQYGGLLRSRPPSPGSIDTRLVDAAPPHPATSSFVTPVVMDSQSTLYGCYADLWQSTDGAKSWSNLSNGKIGKDACSALAVTAGAIYVAKGASLNYLGRLPSAATIYRRTDGGWSDITHHLSARWISDLAVDPENPGTAWVSAAGYGIDNVYALTGGATKWTPVTADLPQVPIYSLAYDRQTGVLYAGSQCGVYRICMKSSVLSTYTKGFDPDSEDPRWQLDSENMPRMQVMDLEIQKYPDGARVLYAATLAQGAWRLQLPWLGAPSCSQGSTQSSSLRSTFEPERTMP